MSFFGLQENLALILMYFANFSQEIKKLFCSITTINLRKANKSNAAVNRA